jgi:phosphoribosylglycinamide formyltransferase-1
MKHDKKKIILFASGNGTNAENLIRYFKSKGTAVVSAVFTNNPNAGVIRRAAQFSVPVHLISKIDFEKPEGFIEHLEALAPDLIVLAGFLWKIPSAVVYHFPGKIVNIHPALLPAYGGKGMYGRRVHEAVLSAGEKKTGITIHYVNEHYDDGQIVFQAETEISANDTPETLAEKVHRLEYLYFPKIVEKLLETRQVKNSGDAFSEKIK